MNSFDISIEIVKERKNRLTRHVIIIIIIQFKKRIKVKAKKKTQRNKLKMKRMQEYSAEK